MLASIPPSATLIDDEIWTSRRGMPSRQLSAWRSLRNISIAAAASRLTTSLVEREKTVLVMTYVRMELVHRLFVIGLCGLHVSFDVLHADVSGIILSKRSIKAFARPVLVRNTESVEREV